MHGALGYAGIPTLWPGPIRRISSAVVMEVRALTDDAGLGCLCLQVVGH